jgi:hypothetical protein
MAKAGQFVGTWEDERGFHATITGNDGKVQVRFTDAGRPGPFLGHEFDPGFAPANIVVHFIDMDPDFQMVQGFLQDAGQKIVWNNDTTWQKVSANT